MPTFVMMVGLPASGKSTFVEQHKITLAESALVASSDAYLEMVAANNGLTYNEVFKDHVKDAQAMCDYTAELAFRSKRDLIWDQTNLNKKTRAKRLRLVPENYKKLAVVCRPPNVFEWNRRLNDRPGKTIPKNIMLSMADSYEEPTKDEGFDSIIFIESK